MSNNNSITPYFAGGAAAGAGALALGGGSVGLAVAGTAVGVPAAVAVGTLYCVGFVAGKVFDFFKPSPKPAARKVINVTAVRVEEDEDLLSDLERAYSQELHLISQGIF